MLVPILFTSLLGSALATVSQVLPRDDSDSNGFYTSKTSYIASLDDANIHQNQLQDVPPLWQSAYLGSECPGDITSTLRSSSLRTTTETRLTSSTSQIDQSSLHFAHETESVLVDLSTSPPTFKSTTAATAKPTLLSVLVVANNTVQTLASGRNNANTTGLGVGGSIVNTSTALWPGWYGNGSMSGVANSSVGTTSASYTPKTTGLYLGGGVETATATTTMLSNVTAAAPMASARVGAATPAIGTWSAWGYGLVFLGLRILGSL